MYMHSLPLHSEIKEDMIPAAFQPSTSTLPPHQGKGAALVVNFKGINDWELAPEHRTLGELVYMYIYHMGVGEGWKTST